VQGAKVYYPEAEASVTGPGCDGRRLELGARREVHASARE
jgi:hypothetical protein